MKTLSGSEWDELVALHERQSDARLLLDAAVKAHAERLDVSPAVLKKAVGAWAADKADPVREDAEALAALLERASDE